MSDLFVDVPATEGMIGALGQSKTILDGIPTEGFVAQTETALPGSGLGHSVMLAGFRARAATRGAGSMVQEISDRARADITAFLHTEGQNTAGVAEAAEPPR
ncbi:hypothetical protein [Nocardia sp. NBC_01329]|uniref:hypothetical protein n=1 Tax=Nocardia sp. NBC_01329 TaxID=2903594 RepID=UPI002E0D394A|nr:hypothetical protein OG405_18275 [Nocardia sp. NBC_01329]